MLGRARRLPARLVVDPIACDGIGICAHLAAEVVAVDDWGYPIVSSEPLGGRDLRAARRAAAGCPRRALRLVPPPEDTEGPPPVWPTR